jgi:hypothetical protein
MLFPWVGLYEQLALADVWVHYDDVQFSKGSFVNRVQLKTANGPSWLTVPLANVTLGQAIGDLVLDDRQPWRERHLDQLRRAYDGAPHVDDVLSLVSSVYERAHASAADLFIDAFETVADRLGLLEGRTIVRSSTLGIDGRSWERVLAAVERLDGDVYVTGHGAARYLDPGAFDRAGVEVRYMDYARTPYPQLHGGFTPHVSILDLLANTGPGAADAIRPRTAHWRDFLAESA